MTSKNSAKPEKLLPFPTTNTFCQYSGLPLQVDTYFGQKIRIAKHWIFEQNPAAIFKLALTARTLQQKKLTQLAMLKTLNAILFDKPLNISDKAIEAYHVKVVEIFTLWLTATKGNRLHFAGGFDSSLPVNSEQLHIFPQLRVSTFEQKFGQNYSDFIEILVNQLLNYYNIDDLDLAKQILDSDRLELPEWEVTLESELREFARISPNRYSKKVGRQLLETLAEYSDNRELQENFNELQSILLNEGFKSADNYSRVYKVILDSQLEGSAFLEHRKLTLNWLQSQIELLLEFEAGFFGKKSFISSTGQIENSSVLYSMEDDDDLDFESKSKLKLKPRKKLVLKLKTRI